MLDSPPSFTDWPKITNFESFKIVTNYKQVRTLGIPFMKIVFVIQYYEKYKPHVHTKKHDFD